MRIFDSDTPREPCWNSLFDAGRVVEWLALTRASGSLAEIGCGYGTFTVVLQLLSLDRRLPGAADHLLEHRPDGLQLTLHRPVGIMAPR
jgi:hypothetical protein